ncbi:MAG: cytochrome c [Truepera sp.]|nr:cytochrome c [Truepera sp.]
MKRLYPLLILLALLPGCGRNMWEQPRFGPLDDTTLFTDGAASRPLPPGVIPRGRSLDQAFLTGLEGGMMLTANPMPLTTELLERGRVRYNAFCSACHNYNGDGLGIVVQRGFPQPTSFHAQRLRDASDGYFFGAITNGFGRMASYAAKITPEDRWAIVAYIRAMQLSQHAPAELLEGSR